MKTEAEVLSALSERLSPGELAQIVSRLVRIPEAWEYLHESGVLERRLSVSSPHPFAAWSLALDSLGMAETVDVSNRLPEPYESRLGMVGIDASTPAEEAPDLETVALAGISLIRRAATQEGIQQVVHSIQSAASRWMSPLACAWPMIQDQGAILGALITGDSRLPAGIVANVLLANLTPDQATSALIAASDGADLSLVPFLRALGAADAIDWPVAPPEGKSLFDDGHFGPDRVNGRLTKAVVDRMRGEVDASRSVLEEAWDSANETLATISDFIADGAREDKESVVEIEARRQSLRTHPTPLRRAWLADALTLAGRPEEAIALLADPLTSIQERIAATSASLALAETSSALEHLEQVGTQAEDADALDPYWIRRISDAAVGLGRPSTAIDWARREVQVRPASPEARRHLASIQSAAGDHLAAADQARIVQALDPSDLQSLQVIASSLQAGGDPKRALPFWQALAASDSAHLEPLAECALASSEYSLAEDAAQRALEVSPKSAKSMVHLGRALMALGDPQTARRHIEQATTLNPDSAEGWIALAESYAAEGDQETAGATLASAVQSVPSNAELHMAYARWLKLAGRLSEALDSVEAAVGLSPGKPSWLVEQGELLRGLGHTDKALDVLKQAAQTWPGSWEARLALALTYESTGKFVEAQEVLGGIPDTASAESRFLAGRILVEAASATGNVERIPEAIASFDSIASVDPRVQIWAGRALVLAGRPGEAIQRYLTCLPKTIDRVSDRDEYLECVVGLAQAAIANDQPELAVSELESARPAIQDSPELLTSLSMAYQAAGLPDQAIQAGEAACSLAPDDPDPLRQLARAALQDGRWERALRTLARLSLIDPESSEIRLDLARASLGAGDIQRARDSLASALFSKRREPTVLRRGASMMLEMGSAPSAKRMLLAAAKHTGPDPDMLAELARVSTEAGDTETALWAWESCAVLNPQDVRAAKQIAAALDRLGRREEAIEAWQNAMKLSPQDPAIPAILARATLEVGDFTSAMDYFELALDRSPEDVDLALQAGRVQLRHGSPEAALATLETAAALSPDRSDVLATLGEACLRVDKPQKALEALQAAAERPDVRPAYVGLLAMAQLTNGDLSAAEATLDRGLRMPLESQDDVIQLSQAALKLTRWDMAIAILERWLSKNDDPAVFRTWITARLRLANARTLYSVAAEASTHAPSPVWEGESFLRGMQAGLSRAGRLGIDDDELATLNVRALAATGKAGEDDLELLEEQALNDPSGETSEGLAIAYLRTGHAVEALRAMLPDPGKRPVGEWAALIIGIGQQAMARHEQARQAFSYAAANPVMRPIAEYLAGRAFIDSGMKDKAITHFNKALASWPNEPAWHYRLAREYLEIDDEGSALPHLQNAVELDPRNGTYLLELARTYRAVGQLDESEATYGRAVYEFPTTAEVWREAGQLALALGKPEHAVTWFDHACRITPDDPHSLVGAARAALALGRTREAREHSLAAQQLAPDDPEVQIAMADVLASQGKVDKALLAYDRALESAPDPLPVRLARNSLLVKAGRAVEAVESLKSLTLTAGEDDNIWASLAEAARAAGDLELAMSAAEHASHLSPRNAGHRLLLARISREAGHLDRALSELSQLGATTSLDPGVAVEIGHLHEDRRELKRALDAYERAINLDPANAEAHYRAGLVLKGLKAYEQAGAMLKRAVELNPRSPDVLHQLAAVRALELVHGGIRQTAVP